MLHSVEFKSRIMDLTVHCCAENQVVLTFIFNAENCFLRK